MRVFVALLLVALACCDGASRAQTPVPDGALRGVLGANKFDLSAQYLGFASNGDGSPPYLAVLTAMARKAIGDAAQNGFGFLRVAAAGYGPVMPSQVSQPNHGELRLWQTDPDRYWSRLDAMFDDLDAAGLRIAPSFVWNPFAFPAIAGETLDRMVADPNSVSRRLLVRYLTEFITRYRGRRTILFWELTNELNLEADIDSVALCRKVWTAEACATHGNFSTAQLNRFAADMVAVIKSLDPAHAVGSGYSLARPASYHLMRQPGFSAAGPDWTADTPAQFAAIETLWHAPFDLVSVHVYPGDMRWGNPAGSEGQTLARAARVARRAGKRLYLGEFGDKADSPYIAAMLRHVAADDVAYAAIWVWEFYQVAPWLSANVTSGPGASLEPGFTDALDHTLARAAGAAAPAATQKPRVVITAPLPCASAGGVMQLHAAASAGLAIDGVAFSVDGVPVGVSTAAPFAVAAALPGPGPHVVRALAWTGGARAATEILVAASPNATCVPAERN